MGIKQIIYILLFVSYSFSLQAQKERVFIRSGNQHFFDSNYVQADTSYLKALHFNEKSIEAQYNLANSQFMQKKYVDAITQYENLIPQLKDKNYKAAVYHNLGNAYLKTQKIEEAINAYKDALRNNPKDADSRYNLAYAKSMMQKNDQNKNENSDQNDKNQKDKEQDKNQENKENQDDKDGQKSDSDKQPDEQKKKQDDDKKNPDKKGDQPDDQGEKDKSKEGNKQEQSDEKGDEKGEQHKDSKEKPGEEKDGEPGGEEGKESDDQTDKKGEGQGEKDNNQPQKVKAISKAKANELLKELESNEKAIRQKMIRSQMKRKNRQKIEKDW